MIKFLNTLLKILKSIAIIIFGIILGILLSPLLIIVFTLDLILAGVSDIWRGL